MEGLERWRSTGTVRDVAGHAIFVVDRSDAAATTAHEPVVLIHGFPTSSYDWKGLIEQTAQIRRVVALDLLGFGLSDKPDEAYSLFRQADIVAALLRDLGIDRCALVTHDMGDSIGGEILARTLDGTLGVDITRRVVMNGSIYMDLVQLSAGQQLLLSLPDERVESGTLTAELVGASLRSLWGSGTPLDDDELATHVALMDESGGVQLLPRTIRYIEERRVHEGRWTAAIEEHPSPLSIVWGDADPIAVWAMAERLATRRPDATLVRLRDIGHFPMLEAADDVGAAVASALG